MNIKVLDSKLQMTTDENGVISYSHPEATTIITSDYKVYNAKNGRELKVYQNEYLVGGQLSSKFKGKRSNFSFGRLLALMAGQPEDGYYRIIDGNKPLTLDNITTLKDYMKTPDRNTKVKEVTTQKTKDVNNVDQQQHLFITALEGEKPRSDNFDIVISKDKIKDYLLDYVPCDENVQYVTEDGLLFTDRAKALLHQLSIDKGKELARKVIKAKAGWVLAEEMYLSQVGYHDGKPIDYNFKTIFENDSGIKEIGDKTYLVEEEKYGTHQFKSQKDAERWLKAKALIDMVVDYRYNTDMIAALIS